MPRLLTYNVHRCVGTDKRLDVDRIVAVGVLEHVGYKNYRDFMQVALRCLADDGLLVVHDFFMEHAPEKAALSDLNMLVNTAGGDTYTEGEVRSWLRRAGFGPAARRDTRFETSLLIARKR